METFFREENDQDKKQRKKILKERGLIMFHILERVEGTRDDTYGDGGFGLNNDCLEVRQAFVTIIQNDLKKKNVAIH